MPETITQTRLRVFLASPSDVTDERQRAMRVIDAMNKGVEAQLTGVHFELLPWENVVPDMGRPEQVIGSTCAGQVGYFHWYFAVTE